MPDDKVPSKQRRIEEQIFVKIPHALAGALFFVVLATVVKLGAFSRGAPMNNFLLGPIYSEQHYFAFYSVILSFLLIHYYFDHFLFLHADAKITPTFEPLTAEAA